MSDAQQKTGLDRPQFDGGNTVLGDLRYARSEAERNALDPSRIDEKLRAAVAGRDFRATVNALHIMTALIEELSHTAAPAFPQDMLEGSGTNNYEGLVERLGYTPGLDRPIGYMKVGGSNYETSLVYPRLIEAAGPDQEAHWAVFGGIRLRNPMQRSRLTQYVSVSAARSAGLDRVPIQFPTFEEAMGAIHDELLDAGYEILEAEPRMSSDISLGSVTTQAEVEQ